MKRILSFVLILTVFFSLAACQRPDINANATPQPTSAVKVTPQPTTAPSEAPTDAPTEAPTEEPTASPLPEGEPVPYPEEPDFSGLPKVIAGTDNFYIAYPDGELYAWGMNANGELGNGTRDKVTVPTLIAEGLVPVVVGETVFALSMDNTLWGWGSNVGGLLGTGDTEDALRPVEILPSIAEVCLGYDRVFAISENGMLYQWGTGLSYDAWARFTEEEIERLKTPQLVLEGVKCLAGRGRYAVKENGELYEIQWNAEWLKTEDDVKNIWPTYYNEADLLETLDGRPYIRKPDGERILLFESFRSVTLDDGMAFIQLENGELFSCIVAQSKITDYNENDYYIPHLIMDGVESFLADSWVDEDWEYCYRFALKDNGELWSWGIINDAALGRGTDGNPGTPKLVAENVRFIVSNGAATYFIDSDSEVWAAGLGREDGMVYGGLGDGTEETRGEFVRLHVFNAAFIVDGYYTDYVEYDDGTDSAYLIYRTFVVQWDGTVLAWGYNGDGMLGTGSEEEHVLWAQQVYVGKD